MTILLSSASRRKALYHLDQFLELTTYHKLSHSTVRQVVEHLEHLKISPDELETTVKVASNEAVRRTVIEITMDLKGANDVTIKEVDRRAPT